MDKVCEALEHYLSFVNVFQIVGIVDKNKDNVITMEDIDGLSDKDLAKIRQLMPMGADSEGEENADDGKEPGNDFEEGGESEDVEDGIGDGFPETEQKDYEESDEKYSHTEL